MKNTIKLLIIIGLLYSCKKEEPIEPIESTTTLTGKIVKNCAGIAMANQEVEIRVSYGVWEKNDVFEAKTDSNGNFNWTFDIKENKYNVKLRLAGIDILSFGSKDRNLGTIIATPTCNVVMKIKVNNPYNLGDTLQLKDLPNHPLKGLKLSAPFRDTILTTAYNYSELSWPDTFEQKNTTYVSTNIYIRELCGLPLL